MKNVDELNRTNDIINAPQTQQTISLSALNSADDTNAPVNINATNGLSGVTEHHESRPVVKINPNHRSMNRPISRPEELHEVDPSEMNIPTQPKPRPMSPRDMAMSQLDAAVARKRQEFHDFIEKATEEDASNREIIEAGIETVNDEMQYMPNALHKEMDESQKVAAPIEETIEEDDFFDDKEPVSSDYDEEVIDNSNTTFEDPFDGVNQYDEPIEIPDDEDNYPDEDHTVKSTEEDEYIPEKNEITVTSSALKDIETASSGDFDIDEADFEDVTSDTDENLTDDQIMEIAEDSEKHLRSEILQKIVQSGKKLNISQLNVSNKVINIKEALATTEKKVERTATWPLTFAGRPYVASALKGPEVALMSDSDTSAEDGVGLSMVQARIMFEHDANPYRPNTLEAWAKTIPFADVENIFAALYIASIKGANYIPMACPKVSCQYAYLTDDTDIDGMVKFESDEAKKRFEDIKKMQLTETNTGSYESVISAINDRFAIGLKLPSIFTILYEYNSLNTEFVNKYTAMVSIIQYIDYMYLIDPETNTLQPIGWKKYPGDNTKTFKSKIATYAKILKELDDTDFSILMALINAMVTKAADTKNVSFEIPAAKCPKCGAEIAARPINARGLVFMRQRLVELATTPIAR